MIGRYALFDKIGSGGMASVFLGRMSGAAGLTRTVAIKRLHPHLAENRELAYMLLDEARITMRIRHPNVVPTVDVTQLGDELLIVMDYVVGSSLAQLLSHANEQRELPPPAIIATIVSGVLHGLHAAHEVKDERGQPLRVVHRDVSPQNILVGADGTARVLDFGIAKAAGRLHSTQDGQAKGKLAYMAPEQLETSDIDRRADVFAAGVVLWEALTLKRLFAEASEALTIARVLRGVVTPPSELVAGLDTRFDEVCARALQRNSRARYATAREMALALEACGTVPTSVVSSYVERLCGDDLRARSARVQRTEQASPDESGESTIKDPTPQVSTLTPVRAPTPVRTQPPENVPTLISVTPQPIQPEPREARGLHGWRLALPMLAVAGIGAFALRASIRPEGAPIAASPAPVSPPVPAPPPIGAVDPIVADAAAIAQAVTDSAGVPKPMSRPAIPPSATRTAAPAAKPKCKVVSVARADGTLDFQEKCE